MDSINKAAILATSIDFLMNSGTASTRVTPTVPVRLDATQMDIIADLMNDQIREVTSGATTYGDAATDAAMVDDMNMIRSLVVSARERLGL